MDIRPSSAAKAASIPYLVVAVLEGLRSVFIERMSVFLIDAVGVPSTVMSIVKDRSSFLWCACILAFSISCMIYYYTQRTRRYVSARVAALVDATASFRIAVARDIGQSMGIAEHLSFNTKWNAPSFQAALIKACKYASRKDRRALLSLGISRGKELNLSDCESAISEFHQVESFIRELKAKYDID